MLRARTEDHYARVQTRKCYIQSKNPRTNTSAHSGVLEEIRDFVGDEGEQMAKQMGHALNATAREIVNQAERFPEDGAWTTRLKTSCEEMGVAIAGACVTFVVENVPHWIDETEKEVAEIIGYSANSSQVRNRFQLELSALVFVSFRIAIGTRKVPGTIPPIEDVELDVLARLPEIES